jgi:hypothetical protein
MACRDAASQLERGYSQHAVVDEGREREGGGYVELVDNVDCGG